MIWRSLRGDKWKRAAICLAVSETLRNFVGVKRIPVFLLLVVLAFTACTDSYERRPQQLYQLQADNRADSLMTNDSLARDLASYFDRHGTPNDQLLAYYLLGRTYADLGQTPQALETYRTAANKADTTAADCDFAILSRVHAQTAGLFYNKLQFNSQLHELRKAEKFAWLGRDTLMAAECIAEQSEAFLLLQQPDSMLMAKQNAAMVFNRIGREDRTAAIMISAVTTLIDRNETSKAEYYTRLFSEKSGLVDDNDIVAPLRGVYYYIKGKVCLAVHNLDSAESLFRKELALACTYNDLIAGCKGLQELYELKGQLDSVAKYAKLSYNYNDTAYSEAEMLNIQRVQAQYDYTQSQLQAERKATEAKNAWMVAIIIFFLAVVSILAFAVRTQQIKRRKELLIEHYQSRAEQLVQAQTDLMALHSEDINLVKIKTEEVQRLQMALESAKQAGRLYNKPFLESRLMDAPICEHLKAILGKNTPGKPELDDWKRLKMLFNEEIPSFYNTLNTSHYTLSEVEYEVCMLLRLHFRQADISRLCGISTSYVSLIQQRLLKKVFNKEGKAEDFSKILKAINGDGIVDN